MITDYTRLINKEYPLPPDYVPPDLIEDVYKRQRLHHSFVESISFAKWTVLPAHSVCISFEIVSVL